MKNHAQIFVVPLFLLLAFFLFACGDPISDKCQSAQMDDDFGARCANASDCAAVDCVCEEEIVTMRSCINEICQGLSVCEEACEHKGGWLCKDEMNIE